MGEILFSRQCPLLQILDNAAVAAATKAEARMKNIRRLAFKRRRKKKKKRNEGRVLWEPH